MSKEKVVRGYEQIETGQQMLRQLMLQQHLPLQSRPWPATCMALLGPCRGPAGRAAAREHCMTDMRWPSLDYALQRALSVLYGASVLAARTIAGLWGRGRA